MKKIRRRAASATDTTGFFEKKEEQAFFPKNDAVIQRRSSGEPDRIHGPLLDQYSKDSGLPRDSVTQHDPGFKMWLQQRSSTTAKAAPVLPINITLDMNAPATDPAPDYSKDETQLGAWERANFLLNAQQFFSCDKIINNGIESSFVTDVGIRLTRADFEYFIARHIYENMNDRTKDASERIIWRQIHGRILIHSREHFARYRQVVDSLRMDFMQRLSALPNRNNPIQISQQELETYVSSLLQYLVARLQFELWQTTCKWEHTDYPNLLKGIRNVSGTFVPACGPKPVVPPAPILPIVVTPSAPLPGKKRVGP